MIPSTVERVPRRTSQCVNERIRRRTEERVARLAAGSKDAINCRLAELDREWDVERVLEANAATASLVGLTLGATVDRKWFLIPALVAGFLLQHTVEGWCPPLPILRYLGFRTQSEIDYERYALKSLRGDFNDMPPLEMGEAKKAEQIVETMRR